MSDPHETVRRVTFKLAEECSRSFLDSVFLELESGGSIVIGLLKQTGDTYGFARIAPEDFFAAVQIIKSKEST